jgi:hypothetical protein
MPAFLDRSRKIQGSQPSGKVNGETAWQELEASRRELLLALERAADRRLEALSRPHPARPDPLNGYQWIAFIGLHEARHAAQLRDLR